MLRQLIEDFHRDERGATATEYIILLILIACFIILIVQSYGETVSDKFSDADTKVGRNVTY